MASKQKKDSEILPPHTDSGNAELIAGLYKDSLRYDHKQGRWIIWSDPRGCWEEDATSKVRILAKNAARFRAKAALSVNDKEESTEEFKWAKQSESGYRLDRALEGAASEQPISDAGDGWDADPMLLGVTNGILDLRTGTMRSATHQDRVTKFCRVRFDSDAKCQRFNLFVDEIFGGDRELIRFVQKAVGYTLTGNVDEHCLFALYGTGRNGKTTFLEVILYLLGDHGVDLPFSNLDTRHYPIGEGVNLPGARFAKSVETRKGRQLDEGRVKSWTGGDTITIRPLHRNAFSFRPTHKLWLAFNHKPEIKDASLAMWSRIRLIPFERTFEKSKSDKKLVRTLKEEGSGILNWALEGCLAWQREGLETPTTVEQATREYQEESDAVGPFIDECCEVGEGFDVPIGELWKAYVAWNARTEETPLSQKEFRDCLDEKGFHKGRIGHKRDRVRRGLRLRRAQGTADARTDADASFELIPIDNSRIEETQDQRPHVSACPQTATTQDPKSGTIDPNDPRLTSVLLNVNLHGDAYAACRRRKQRR